MKKFLAILLCAVMTFINPLSVPPVYAASTVSVDLSSVIRPVTHCATGSLYGVLETTPDMSMVLPLRPNCLTNPAVAGSGYQQSVGAAIPVLQRFANTTIGTKMQIRLADWFPGWYNFTNLTDWFNKMTTTVNAVKAAGLTASIYGYEIFNEPDDTFNATKNGISFNEFFSQSVTKLKQLDSTAKTIGPSFAGYDHAQMLDFMTYQKNHNTLPDIICWHDLFTPPLASELNDYRAIETSLGITPRPITMNEYSQSWDVPDEGVPGSVAPLIAKFERFKFDNATQTFWHKAGTLGSLLTSSGARNGGWWFYKWYGDMSGNMVSTTGANTNNARAVDAFACVDTAKKYASVLFGGTVDGGATNVVIKNFPSALGTNGGLVHVRVDYAPFTTTDTAVNSTIKVAESDYTITNNQITVPVSGMNALNGYRIYITPYGAATNRYEAEDSAIYHANISTGSNASNGKYIGQIDYNDSYLDFYVNVSTTGNYTLSMAYANGTGANSTQQLSVNGGTATTVTYPSTSGWGQFGSVNVNARLNAGDNIIRVTKGSTGYAELDYINVNYVGGGTGSGIQSGHVYKLQNVNSSKVLGVSGMSTSDGVQILQWSDNGTADHNWTLTLLSNGYYKLTNANSNKVLGISGAATNDGANAIQFSDNGAADQEWQLVNLVGNTYKLINKNSGKVLGISGMSTSDGANAIQWSDNGTADHNWNLIFVQ